MYNTLIFISVIFYSDDEIRECVFLSLDERFDPHLAQAESLTTLFVAMHDGVSQLGVGGRSEYSSAL